MTTATAPAEVIYTAPTGNRTAGRIHRAACKYIAKGAARMSPADAGVDALLDATRATCCSVREADREHAVTAARNAEMDAAEAAEVPAAAKPARPPRSAAYFPQGVASPTQFWKLLVSEGLVGADAPPQAYNILRAPGFPVRHYAADGTAHDARQAGGDGTVTTRPGVPVAAGIGWYKARLQAPAA